METKKLSLETSHLIFVKNFAIPKTNGSDDFYDRDFPLGNEFYQWIDPDFDKWDLVPVNKNTSEMKVAIYKQQKDGILKDLIDSLDREIPLMSILAHQQVSAFISANLDLLENTHCSVHFIYKDQTGRIYVITASGDVEEGLNLFLRHLDANTPWRASDKNYLVIPRLECDE
jgi:hypothetical protein